MPSASGSGSSAPRSGRTSPRSGSACPSRSRSGRRLGQGPRHRRRPSRVRLTSLRRLVQVKLTPVEEDAMPSEDQAYGREELTRAIERRSHVEEKLRHDAREMLEVLKVDIP